MFSRRDRCPVSCRIIKSGAFLSLKYLLRLIQGELHSYGYIFFIRSDGTAH